MTDIWGFFLQTLTVTMVAGLLLAVKTLLREQLSPRWQYGVWSVLALRALVPARMGMDGVIPFALWLETVKAWAEQQLGSASAFTDIYRPIAVKHVLPVVTGRPVTVADWLFAVYAAGVLMFALGYLVRYIRLRRLLRRRTDAARP